MGLLSSIFGGGDSGKTSGSSTQQMLPMPQLAPSFQSYGDLLNAFMGQPGTAFDMYQGPTLAQTSPYTNQAISALVDPSAFMPTQNYYQSVLQGDYLGLNPQMQQAVMNPAIQATNASYNQLGRFGSPGNAQASQLAAMQAMMPYYDNERQRQGQAAAMLPGLQQMWGNQLAQAGGMQQAVGQRDITEAQNQFAQQNYDPRLAALGAYSGLLGVGSGYGTNTGTTQSQLPDGSPVAGMLGGAALGGGLATSLWGPQAFAAGSFAAPFAWPMLIGGGLLGGLL